jgi:HAD superfamily hydrolase (TIGR01549 family)
MIEAVLFDLDDTLLGNSMDNFFPSYFPLLSAYLKDFLSPDVLVQELMIGTQAMIKNVDGDRTNSDVFWDVFCRRTGLDRQQFEPKITRFYQEEFSQLKELTQVKPAAKEIVEYCFHQKLKVVIATNPLFPMSAIQQRLSWAGVPGDIYDYSFVTAYENMHSSKPHVDYYEEILKIIDVPPFKSVMVGDNWENDMVPAAALGLRTYWITNDEQVESDNISLISKYGTLDALLDLFSSGWLEN